jgi:diguanylate cyclase (GGDEF)-like protein/PAS domain S-box-containing protein
MTDSMVITMRPTKSGSSLPAGVRTPDGLSHLVREIPSAVMQVATDGRLLYANPGSWLLLQHWRISAGECVPDEVRELARQTAENQIGHELEVTVGHQVLSLLSVPVPGRDHVNLYGRDTTRQKAEQGKLLLDAQVFEHASEGIMITDGEQRILDVNNAFTTITGYTQHEILGEKPSRLASGRHDPTFYTAMWDAVNTRGAWQGEIWDRRKNGEVHPKWLSLSAVKDAAGGVSHYIGVFSDITTAKQTEESLYHLSHYDSITGLANRRSFQDRLEKALGDARRFGEKVGLVLLDLDEFTLVNDTLGHRAGDQLLRETADRLKEALRESDTIARMGGDEFAVILTGLRTENGVAQVMETIEREVSRPHVLDGQEVAVTACIGAALFPQDASGADLLVRSADTALNRAREQGTSVQQFFSAELTARAEEHLSLHARLRRGIERGELFVAYQPQVDHVTGTLVGLEALARWQNADLGLVSPGRFIPLAEETGLISGIGDLVLRGVCGQIRAWMQAGRVVPRIGVNVSARDLQRPATVEAIERVVQEAGLPPDLLEFELTESTLVADFTATSSRLERLKKLGATIAIDDFGTGYSSLAYLKRLPIDRLKIDASFVRELPGSDRDCEIASAIIAVARSLRLEVIAEGVETAEQARFLADKGCVCMQGWLHGRPAAPADIAARLPRSERPSA